MDTPKRQQGRHFVVTGAGSGIGRAIAHRLAAEGAVLTLLGRDVFKLQTVAEELRTNDATVHLGQCDVRNLDRVLAEIGRGAEVLGPVHGCIANAGVGGANHPGAGDRWDEIVRTNLDGTYYTLRAAERHLASGPGTRQFVVVSSILGRIGVPGYTAYCAAKAGLLGLVRAMAMELAPLDVQVNAVCPGWVNTDMAWSGIDGIAKAKGIPREQALKEEMAAVPMGRMAEPVDVAGLVAWLLSQDARGVTGQGLDMNGGAWM